MRALERLDKIASRKRAANAKQTRTLVLIAIGAALLATIGVMLALGIGLPPAPKRPPPHVNDVQLRKAPK